MSNAHIVKHKLHELASQVYILATGLQNVAPPGAPGQSVQYLLEIAAELEQASLDAEKLLSSDSSRISSS